MASARAAVQEGVVPGGGAALLACIPAVEALGLEGDEAVGAQIWTRALAEPMRVLAQNAGLDGRADRRPGPRAWPGLDLRRDPASWVDAWKAGLLDPLPVVTTALETAVSAAGVALTSDVLIHRPDAPVVVQP